LAPGVRPTALSSGFSHSLAIGSDNHLYAWGSSEAGQLGDGTTMNHLTPQQISLAPGVTPTMVSAGTDTSFAIGSDHNLYAWGDHCVHTLGDGVTWSPDCTFQLTPEVITLAAGVTATAVSAGDTFGIAIGSDGYVYGWGWGGALGLGSTVLTATLVDVPDGNGGWVPFAANAIAAGSSHSLAISDGSLYSWGYNSVGQLGNGSHDSEDYPQIVPGVAPTLISASAHNSLAVDATGTLWSWGADFEEALGNGDTPSDGMSPEPITLAPGVSPTAICAGEHVGFAIGSDGRLYGWGRALLLGMGSYQPSPVPIAVAIRPTAISSRRYNALATIAP